LMAAPPTSGQRPDTVAVRLHFSGVFPVLFSTMVLEHAKGVTDGSLSFRQRRGGYERLDRGEHILP